MAVGLAGLALCVLGSSAPRAQTPQAGGASPPAGRGGLARPEPYDFNDHDAGWVSLFDGTLNGWDGNPAVWRVEDAAIVASSTPERRVGTTYIIWKGGEVGDFELKLEIKLEGEVHSGIAYRSWTDPDRAGRLGPAAPPAGGNARGAEAGGPGAGRRGRAALPPPQIASEPRWMLYGPGLDFDADRRNSGNVEERGSARGEFWRRAGSPCAPRRASGRA